MNIFGLTLLEIKNLINKVGLESYIANQLTNWIYAKKVYDFNLMTNISLKNRDLLSSNFFIKVNPYIKQTESKDGTKKYLFEVDTNNTIETVVIPDNERLTICVSSQVGCSLGCKFCQTGKMKFQKNLASSEILSQLINIPDFEKITNIVFMGMGEPFLNFNSVKNASEIITSKWGYGFSKNRITISSVGLIPELKTFVEQPFCELAISLHSPFHEQRKELVPIENKYPISEVVKVLKTANSNLLKKISFEYIVFKNINHSNEHVNELYKLLYGLPAKINLTQITQ